MATDRVIKTDGDLDITATDTSISGTLNVSGQATLSGLAYPTSDGSADQVIKTDGSGNLSFVDQASGGGGVDTITSASEASSYSGTNKIIQITASTDVIFTSALSNRIIINETANETNFYANLTNCTVNTKGNIEIRNTSTSGTNYVDVLNCKLMCDTLTVNNSGNASGTQINFLESIIHARNITFSTQALSSGYFFNKCNVFAGDILTMPPSGGGNLNIWFSNVNVNEIAGFTNLNTSFASTINVREGASSSTQLQIGGTDYLTSAYSYPFKIDKNGIDTKVVCRASNSASISNFSTSSTVLSFDTETFDNTGSFSSNRFTAKIKGFYNVTYHTRFSSVGSSEFVTVMVRVNGVTERGSLLLNDSAVNTSIVRGGDTLLLDLDSGDYVEIYAAASASGINYSGTDSHFQINKIN